MRTTFRIQVIAAAAATTLLIIGAYLVMPAKADTPQMYFGVHGGRALANTELSAPPATLTLDGLGSDGYVAGVHAGVDMKLPGSVIFFGVFGGYDWQNTAFNAGTFNASLGNSWYAGGRAGVVVKSAKFYALAAYRQTEWSTNSLFIAVDELRGLDLGIGIEIPLAKNVTLGLEGISTQYRNAELNMGPAGGPFVGSGLHQETEQLSAMARLSFAFGGVEAPAIFADEPAPCDPKLGCKKPGKP